MRSELLFRYGTKTIIPSVPSLVNMYDESNINMITDLAVVEDMNNDSTINLMTKNATVKRVRGNAKIKATGRIMLLNFVLNIRKKQILK